MAADSFLVLGDLGADRYVVRMFVGDDTFDEEITCPLADLTATVEQRMAALAATPDPDLRVEAERPLIYPGHAIPLEVE